MVDSRKYYFHALMHYLKVCKLQNQASVFSGVRRGVFSTYPDGSAALCKKVVKVTHPYNLLKCNNDPRLLLEEGLFRLRD